MIQSKSIKLRIWFYQDGGQFYYSEIPPLHSEFDGYIRWDAETWVKAGDIKAAEEALKEFLIWCHDKNFSAKRVPD